MCWHLFFQQTQHDLYDTGHHAFNRRRKFLAEIVNLLGGNSTYVRGIYYTPKGKLEISGNSDFNVNSQYFPVVVDQLELGGTGDFNLRVDNDSYGYPEQPSLMTKANRTVWLTQ